MGIYVCKKGKRITSIFVLALLCLSVILPFMTNQANAAKAPTPVQKGDNVVRVGFCDIDGFFEYDENGKRSGYGVDLLDSIATVSNLKFEYVDAKDWEDLSKMIRNDEIDLMMPVAGTNRTSSDLDYSSENILYTYKALMTNIDRDDLYYEDSDEFNNMKIAVLQTHLDNPSNLDYFSQLKVAPNYVVYDTFYNCKKALENKEVDALVSNIMDFDGEKMKIIARFDPMYNYIVMRKGDKNLNKINVALTNLKLNNPSYLSDLEETYFPGRNITPFTKEELDYMEKNSKIKVGMYVDNRPMTYKNDKGKYIGINVEILKFISEKTGVDIQIVPISNEEDLLDYLKKGEVDAIFPGVFNEGDEYNNTMKVLSSTISFASLNGEVPNDIQSVKAGVLENDASVINALQREGYSKNITLYTTPKRMLRAINKGEIQVVASNSYAMSYLLRENSFSKMREISLFPIQNNWFFTCKKSEQLQGILNKSIESISKAEITGIINTYMVVLFPNKTFIDLIMENGVVVTVLVIGLVILIMFIIWYLKAKQKFLKELEKKNKALNEANEAKSRFLSNVSHDMRTPMNAIMGLTNLALDEGSFDNQTKDYLEDISSSSQYLLGLINDVLDMAKIESGEFDLRESKVTYADFKTGIIAMIQPLAVEKNIELKFNESQVMVDILSDKLRLNQILFNLLSNAVKFTPENGKIEVSVFSKLKKDNRVYCIFSVKDNGIGMDEEFQKTIFNPFTRDCAVEKSQIEGTGLGLCIVKNIVDKMGGTIEVNSHRGEGSEFIVHLDFPACQAPEKGTSKEAKTDLLQGKRVLLIEDHPMNTYIARKILEKAGMVVTCAENGQIGVDTFTASKAGNFDVILMDIRMPVKDGLAAAREIRSLNRDDGKTIPIIAMTANAYEEDKERSFAVGMNAHLAKPINSDILLETIESFF